MHLDLSILLLDLMLIPFVQSRNEPENETNDINCNGQINLICSKSQKCCTDASGCCDVCYLIDYNQSSKNESQQNITCSIGQACCNDTYACCGGSNLANSFSPTRKIQSQNSNNLFWIPIFLSVTVVILLVLVFVTLYFASNRFKQAVLRFIGKLKKKNKPLTEFTHITREEALHPPPSSIVEMQYENGEM